MVAKAAVDGMNFTWCGQSCGSTSRAFIHDSIYEPVIERLPAQAARFRPGLPTDPQTTMGAIVSRAQYERVLRYIETGTKEGARLVCGGRHPEDASLAKGYFIEPNHLRGCPSVDDDREGGSVRSRPLRSAMER